MYPDMYIALNPDTACKIGISFFKKVFLQFGMKHLKVLIRIDSSLDDGTCILSKKAVQFLSIPTFLEYEVILCKKTLLIGPYIGIIHSSTRGEISEYKEKSLSFIEQYKDIKGAIISFSLKNIDINKNKIKGFLYDPNEQKWISGIYPYPASFFKRAVLGKKSLLYLQNVFGRNFFNSDRYNKWEMYQWLVQNSELSLHLPTTVLYTKPEDIFNFLEDNPNLYIKPLYGSKGKGIIKVMKDKDLISVKYKKNENFQTTFNTIDEAYTFFDNFLKHGSFIIQKMLDISYNNDQVVDFRLILMKDQCGDWVDLGLYGRIGCSQNIVSNRSSGGKVVKDIFAFKQIYKFSQEEALFYKDQMINIAIKAAKEIDKLGFNMGRYGIDLAIDKNKNIWLLEMNHKDPNDSIASYAGNKELIHQIRFNNILYAKKIAGFSKHKQHTNIKILCGDFND